jgi:hypothetical protein
LQVIALCGLPIPDRNSGVHCKRLAAYSGGTVRDLHPLPFYLLLIPAKTSKQIYRITKLTALNS